MQLGASQQQLQVATEHARAADARTEQAAGLVEQYQAAATAKAELEDVVGRLLQRQRETTAREQKVGLSPLLLWSVSARGARPLQRVANHAGARRSGAAGNRGRAEH
jgi:hypothetical protein